MIDEKNQPKLENGFSEYLDAGKFKIPAEIEIQNKKSKQEIAW